MKNLWFLDIENFDSLICTPPGLGELVRLRRLSVFIVGGDASHEIHQLKELNLSGELSIKGLDNVRNLDDAKCANLITKKDLTSLTLSWTNDIKKKPAQHFAEVLQGLQPHEDLEKICIKSYQGSVLPNWMSTLALNKLTQITLENCQRCEHLPSFGQLPFLTCLKLHGMDSIIRLNAELHVQNFPSLESLTIQLCPKLTGLPKLPSLRTLNISCSSVALLTSITFLTSLTSLKLFDFPELDVFPGGFLQNHKALKDLKLGALPIRTLSNVFGNLPALKTLSLDDCANLEFLPEGLKYLNSLERLDINRCDSLSSFPATMLESLPSLRWLSFQHCKKLIPLTGSMNRAPALQSLLINRLPELEYLPESLQQLSGIRVLKIWDCERLCSLPNWLSSLGSLSEISIRYCEELKSLPDDFNSQKSLRMLEIKGRPQLEMRCNKPMGEDWPKISDIPNIIINHQFIQRQ
ncbi:putative disease resistance protein rga4 [Phtheirospermum japonicum]|uniref:Putative disease resistance protein rga4 n=1 Tax=Phtheirospermum japonicum TaxID=374723 RepID=A0A830B8F0_9LAMI|nr:putative disease resistance protein rga4 [Phtheirospermum japonicum]